MLGSSNNFKYTHLRDNEQGSRIPGGRWLPRRLGPPRNRATSAGSDQWKIVTVEDCQPFLRRRHLLIALETRCLQISRSCRRIALYSAGRFRPPSKIFCIFKRFGVLLVRPTPIPAPSPNLSAVVDQKQAAILPASNGPPRIAAVPERFVHSAFFSRNSTRKDIAIGMGCGEAGKLNASVSLDIHAGKSKSAVSLAVMLNSYAPSFDKSERHSNIF
jgi:hypothetical protein